MRTRSGGSLSRLVGGDLELRVAGLVGRLREGVEQPYGLVDNEAAGRPLCCRSQTRVPLARLSGAPLSIYQELRAA